MNIIRVVQKATTEVTHPHLRVSCMCKGEFGHALSEDVSAEDEEDTH